MDNVKPNKIFTATEKKDEWYIDETASEEEVIRNWKC